MVQPIAVRTCRIVVRRNFDIFRPGTLPQTSIDMCWCLLLTDTKNSPQRPAPLPTVGTPFNFHSTCSARRFEVDWLSREGSSQECGAVYCCKLCNYFRSQATIIFITRLRCVPHPLRGHAFITGGTPPEISAPTRKYRTATILTFFHLSLVVDFSLLALQPRPTRPYTQS